MSTNVGICQVTRKWLPDQKQHIDIYTIDETSIRLVLDRQRGRIAL